MAKPNFLKRLNPAATPDSTGSSTSTDIAPIGDITDPEGRKHEVGRASRIGLWSLLIAFGAFLLWAGFAPLDEGVPSQGHVALDTKRKAVQHLSGGIVKEVLVGESSTVKEGQLLIKLDDAVAKANYESVRQRYLGLRAMQGRLLAEQTGASAIAFHPDLQTAASDPLIRQQMQNQEQLMQSRRASLQAELQSIEESIQGQLGQNQAYKSMLESRRSQQALISEELGQTRGLVKDGYAPRNRQLELERQMAEFNASMAEIQGNIVRSTRSMNEMRQRAIARKQDSRKEIESQLADVSREVLSDSEKYQALQNDLTRTDIRSPAAGQVVGLNIQTVGGVVSPGQKLMDIVPANEELLLETRILPHLIDRVKTGMPVDVRFSSFSNSPQLVLDGKVLSVSADLLTEPQTGITYYLARVVVTPHGMKQLGKRQMQPGMPVEVILRTGERSMLTYMLHPLTKRIAGSMIEE